MDALLKDGIVIRLTDSLPEQDILDVLRVTGADTVVKLDGYDAMLGDVYADGKFYRSGELVDKIFTADELKVLLDDATVLLLEAGVL